MKKWTKKEVKEVIKKELITDGYEIKAIKIFTPEEQEESDIEFEAILINENLLVMKVIKFTFDSFLETRLMCLA